MSDELRLRYYKTGNGVADQLAKTAVLRHPQPDREQIEELSKQLVVSRLVCDLAGKLLPSWPRLDLSSTPL
eukprot:3859649-Pyramimonas_sp.AAC.1